MRLVNLTCSLIVYTLLCLPESDAQTFYANKPASIEKINVSRFECTVTDVPVSCVDDFFSIALFSDTLYFLSVGSGLYRTLLSNPSDCEKVMDLEPLNSLTVDKNGMLYGAMATRFFKIDPHRKTVIESQLSFASAGDMIFYKDRLFLAASPNIIAEVNIDSPWKSVEYFSIAETNIYGLTSISAGCSKNKVFGLTSNGVETKLIELDMENRKSLGVKCILEGSYHDAASTVETGNVNGLVIDNIEKRNICFASGKPSYIKINLRDAYETYTYQLNTGVSNSTGLFENLNAGVYRVHVFSKDSCTADTTVVITQGYCDIRFPSAFTPNADGLNDVFKPLGLTPNGKALLSIYNRWGKKIFETENFSQGWNGKFNGLTQPFGTYIYTFKYQDADNRQQFLKGTVEIIH